jgi:ABC-type sugar transport systems, ATPase components
VKEAAALLDLTEYLDRTTTAHSGGERQRVAMGRAIVREPEVFLMDDLGVYLDATLRVSTRTPSTDWTESVAHTIFFSYSKKKKKGGVPPTQETGTVGLPVSQGPRNKNPISSLVPQI